MKTPKKSSKPKQKASKKNASSAAKASSSLTMIPMPVAAGVVQRRTTGGKFRFSNRELVSTVLGTSAWSCLSFEVNPGRSECFPWLSGWATCFDVYRIHSLEFLYTPIASTSTSAEVGLGFDYHVTDPPPSDLISFSQTWLTVTGPSYTTLRMKIDTSKFNYKQYFTRATGLSLEENADVGNFLVTTFGNNGSTLGRLWVEYDIELLEPQARQSDPVTEIGYPPENNISTYPGPALEPELWPLTSTGWTNLVPTNAFVNGTTLTKAGNSDWWDFPLGSEYAKVTVTSRGNVNATTAGFTTEAEDTYQFLNTRNCTVERLNKAYDVVSPWATTAPSSNGKASQTYLLRAVSAAQQMGILPQIQTGLASTCVFLLPYIVGALLTKKQYDSLLTFVNYPTVTENDRPYDAAARLRSKGHC